MTECDNFDNEMTRAILHGDDNDIYRLLSNYNYNKKTHCFVSLYYKHNGLFTRGLDRKKVHGSDNKTERYDLIHMLLDADFLTLSIEKAIESNDVEFLKNICLDKNIFLDYEGSKIYDICFRKTKLELFFNILENSTIDYQSIEYTIKSVLINNDMVTIDKLIQQGYSLTNPLEEHSILRFIVSYKRRYRESTDPKTVCIFVNKLIQREPLLKNMFFIHELLEDYLGLPLSDEELENYFIGTTDGCETLASMLHINVNTIKPDTGKTLLQTVLYPYTSIPEDGASLYDINDVLRCTRWLLSHGAVETINHIDSNGNTALFYACIHNNIPLLRLLIKHHAEINDSMYERLTTDELIEPCPEGIREYNIWHENPRERNDERLYQGYFTITQEVYDFMHKLRRYMLETQAKLALLGSEHLSKIRITQKDTLNNILSFLSGSNGFEGIDMAKRDANEANITLRRLQPKQPDKMTMAEKRHAIDSLKAFLVVRMSESPAKPLVSVSSQLFSSAEKVLGIIRDSPELMSSEIEDVKEQDSEFNRIADQVLERRFTKASAMSFENGIMPDLEGKAQYEPLIKAFADFKETLYNMKPQQVLDRSRNEFVSALRSAPPLVEEVEEIDIEDGENPIPIYTDFGIFSSTKEITLYISALEKSIKSSASASSSASVGLSLDMDNVDGTRKSKKKRRSFKKKRVSRKFFS